MYELVLYGPPVTRSGRTRVTVRVISSKGQKLRRERKICLLSLKSSSLYLVALARPSSTRPSSFGGYSVGIMDVLLVVAGVETRRSPHTTLSLSLSAHSTLPLLRHQYHRCCSLANCNQSKSTCTVCVKLEKLFFHYRRAKSR